MERLDNPSLIIQVLLKINCHYDHLDSIRFVTDSLGAIVNAYEYDS